MPSYQEEDYIRQASFTVQDLIPVEKYRSKRTGLTVCIAHVEGPLVNGYFCVATEAHDDDGLPHTLEHLVFMGSEKYPYKGMLDLFANRCLAQGTNAWTDTDHTCYTMTTAGSEGFLNLLPIYLDHVLYPTLTKSAYVTEVHHINGDGDNAGVVYCEMQARENTGESRTYLEFLRNMYPGICGYKSETGGIMKNLRTSCSHEKVCDYHRTFYRPDNLCIIVTGQVNASDIFKAIAPFEDKILAKGQLPEFDRPWQTAVPSLEGELVAQNQFPTEDESTGMVILGWRGPHVLDYYANEAMKILLNYLTDTPVAPLQQDLVEIEEPYCSDIGFSMLENLETSFFFKAEGVGKEVLGVIKTRVADVLKKLVSKEIKLDMKRIGTLLHREILECKVSLENSGHDSMAQYCIGDFLYSDHPEKLAEYTDRFTRLEKLKAESEDYWINIIKTYMIEQPRIVIEGDPSEDLMKTMAADEEERIKQQREALGDKGLKEKLETLEIAKEENEVEPPAEVVNSLSIPSTSSICFHEITTISNRRDQFDQKNIQFPVHEIPFAFQLDHVKSLFAEIRVLSNTALVPEHLRMYLPLFSEMLFESPVLRDGKIIPYEVVVNELAADTIETDAAIGYGGARFQSGKFSKLFDVSILVEADKFKKGLQWMENILYKVQFTTERIRIVANKIINDVPGFKRSGRKVVSALIKDMAFTKECNAYIVNMMRQHDFLSKLLKKLDTNAPQIIAEMEELRSSLTQLQSLRFYVVADVNRLPANSVSIIKSTFAEQIEKAGSIPRDLPIIVPDYTFQKKDTLSKAIGVGSVESNFLYQTCPSINSYNHKDYAPLMVFIEYLVALEGPLWRQIRGLGLSYHYSINLDPTNGILTFALFKSTQIFEAYKKAKEIVDGFLSGATPFDEDQIEAAISGVIFAIIEKEQNVSGAATQSILSEFKAVEPSFSRTVLKRLSEVTPDDLIRVGNTYFTNLFDPALSSCALCCHPSKIDGIIKDFEKLSRQFVVVKSLEEEFAE